MSAYLPPLAIPRLDCGEVLKVKRQNVIDVLWHDTDYTELSDSIAVHERQRRLPSDLGRSCGCPQCLAACKCEECREGRVAGA